MTYSAALFADPQAPLEEAQRTKYRRLAERLQLQAGQRLLEIGCGWGGFAEFVAREFGARVTAITISAEQHAFAAARMQAAGLAERVEVRLQDYRDVGAASTGSPRSRCSRRSASATGRCSSARCASCWRPPASPACR